MEEAAINCCCLFHGVSDAMADVKGYYLKGEHYDWVTDPRLLESVFHFMRERLTVKLGRQYLGNSTILDIGCGTGRICRNFKGDIIAFDINLWNLRKTMDHVPHCWPVVGDAENLPVASNSIDFALCTEILEHIPKPDNLIGEIHRILKPEGKLLLTVPSDNPIWRLRKHLTYTHPAMEPFHRNYNCERLRALLAGFRIIGLSKVLLGLTFMVVAEKT